MFNDLFLPGLDMQQEWRRRHTACFRPYWSLILMSSTSIHCTNPQIWPFGLLYILSPYSYGQVSKYTKMHSSEKAFKVYWYVESEKNIGYRSVIYTLASWWSTYGFVCRAVSQVDRICSEHERSQRGGVEHCERAQRESWIWQDQ